MNKASVIGICLGIAAILGGNLLEGGRLSSIVQGSAALIVFGGTFGAVFLSFSLKDIMMSANMLRSVFVEEKQLPEDHAIIRDMVDYAARARQKGILSLESEMGNIRYSFFRRALRLVVDGIDPKVLLSSLEQDNRTFEEERGRAARVFEAAGGYAPTIGIIGAVLGLIHVMENLSDPAKLGSGIAVAFVATVYGVASANLVFLPIAKKMMNNIKREIFLREMIIDGVLSIQAGRSPYYLREHLGSYIYRK
ncbi:MAG: flagellar motor protein [Nitrospiraceae bacterium]|nr:MAG: flagellar motor protein [Nitrospiraceae bacterium]